MKRYELNKKRKHSTGKVFYASIKYPSIERKSSDLYIRSRVWDRLDNLSYEFYKDVTLWWIIAQANELGKGSMSVPPGMQLRIPMDTDSVVEKYNKILRDMEI